MTQKKLRWFNQISVLIYLFWAITIPIVVVALEEPGMYWGDLLNCAFFNVFMAMMGICVTPPLVIFCLLFGLLAISGISEMATQKKVKLRAFILTHTALFFLVVSPPILYAMGIIPYIGP